MVTPVGKLDITHPGVRGILTSLPYACDWRPGDDWRMVGCEYIEPLRAIQPAPWIYPRDMRFNPTKAWVPADGNEDLAWWTLGTGSSPHVREAYASFSKRARSLWFYDARPHTSPVGNHAILESPLCIHRKCRPNVALHLIQYAPPPYQQIYAGVAFAIHARRMLPSGATEQPGLLSLVLPVGVADYPTPFWHWIYDAERTGSWTYWEDGRVLSQGPADTCAVQGARRETYIIETVASDLFSGTHLLVRQANNMRSWWHYYDPTLNVYPWSEAESPTGHGCQPWRVVIQGHSCIVNVTPLRYGNQNDNDFQGWQVCAPPYGVQLAQPESQDYAPWSTNVTYSATISLPRDGGWQVYVGEAGQ